MAFTYDITTDRGKVRLHLADANSAAYVFEDDEIDYLLEAAGGSIRGAAASGYELLAGDALRRKKLREYGDERVEERMITDFLALADKLRAQAQAQGGVSVGKMTAHWPEDSQWPPHTFPTTGTTEDATLMADD